MKTQTIEVEGLPEGFEVKSLKIHVPPETLMQITKNNHHYNLTIDLARANADVVLKKIQTRRIVLEEISKEEYHMLFNDERCSDIYNMRGSYWREVKETDIPLNSDDSTKWAEDLILQLPEHHEGRNSWLCHYGMSNQAEEKRKSSIFEYVKSVGRFNISKRKDK